MCVSADKRIAAGGVAAAGRGSGRSGPERAAGVQSARTGSKRLYHRQTVTGRRQQSQFQMQDLHTVTYQTDRRTDHLDTLESSSVCICVLHCFAWQLCSHTLHLTGIFF